MIWKFKDLGLLIIDEEQRFGVQHKEKIKKLKENVDVLTLTATPIPRTLHMSLIGIRDMSVLEEAPEERMPIQTYVMEYNDEMVREAIEREISRQGQVYYVYNRVEDIAEVTAHIQKLVPEVTVAYAHGQMKEHQLERIMYEFISGEIDVLVSTTIIETGLDISNVNTMIIHDGGPAGGSPSSISCGGVLADLTAWPMHFCFTGGIRCSKKWRRNGWRLSGNLQILAPGLRSLCGIWRSGEPEIFWEQSSTGIWRPWAMIFTVRC